MNQIKIGALILRICFVLVAGTVIYTNVPTTTNQTSTIKTPNNNVQIKTAFIETAQTSQPQTNYLIPGAAVYAHTFGIDEARRLSTDGVIIGQDSTDGCMELIDGNILLNQDKNMAICFDQGKIHIGAGATIFIMQSENGTIIYDLLQTKPKQVSVVIEKQKLFIDPGQMLILAKQKSDDFEKLALNCYCIDYHNAKSVPLYNSEMQAYTAEFSISSAVVTIEPLKRLLYSNNEQDKLALNKLIKNIAILQGPLPNDTM